LREPKWRSLRIPAGVLFVFGGIVGFLPLVGFWMLPLGLALLAPDVPLAGRALKNQSCHRRGPRGQQESFEQHTDSPAIGGKRESPHDTFVLSKSLLTGLTYPHDWGFVPSTKADDGDPLDIMVIHDAATFPGIVLTCRIIGILQIEQKSKGKAERNDRLFAAPRRSRSE
jgi:Inorganic pyrophosphatase